MYAIRAGERDPTQPLRKHSEVSRMLGPPPDGHPMGGSVPVTFQAGPSIAQVRIFSATCLILVLCMPTKCVFIEFQLVDIFSKSKLIMIYHVPGGSQRG